LAALMSADDERQADECIGLLLTQHADPVVRGVINRTVFRLGSSGPQNPNIEDIQEVEDLVSQVLLRLMEKLRGIKAQGRETAIRNFPAYVASLAQNVCNDYLRQKWPERSRLKNKTHYILSNDRRFAIWEDGSAGRICGLVEWRDQAPPVARVTLANMQIYSTALPAVSSEQRPNDIVHLLDTIFRLAGAPLPIEDALKLLAAAMGITGAPGEQTWGLDHVVSPGEIQYQHSPDARDAEARLEFEWVWHEICKLPREQRRCLLLSLSDDGGDSILAILLHDRLISDAELAKALEMDAQELAAIWHDLPLDDAGIAAILGVGRRKVSHYRLSARRRLTRRTEYK
jgi:DNA-directed RNA polymerase specialized sigma24 family protein